MTNIAISTTEPIDTATPMMTATIHTHSKCITCEKISPANDIIKNVNAAAIYCYKCYDKIILIL